MKTPRAVFTIFILQPVLGFILSGCERHTDNKKTDIRIIYEQSAGFLAQPTFGVDSVIDTVRTTPKAVLAHKPLTLIIKNLASATAPVIISMYGIKNKFLDEFDQLKQYKFMPGSKELNAQITDLEYGEFAFASYQDVNQDGKINRNKLGLPKEPYCFSNNYKPIIRAPKFKECRFYYNDSTNTVIVKMIR